MEFVSTAEMSLDARAALGSPRLNAFHFVGDLALVIGGIWFGIIGYPLGFLAAIFGALMLGFSQVDPIQRWRIKRYYGSLLGRRVTVEMDEEGLRFTNDLGATQFPWPTLTSIRSNDKTVVFLRERAILGYIPASAFSSEDERIQAVKFARDHVAATQTSRG